MVHYYGVSVTQKSIRTLCWQKRGGDWCTKKLGGRGGNRWGRGISTMLRELARKHKKKNTGAEARQGGCSVYLNPGSWSRDEGEVWRSRSLW